MSHYDKFEYLPNEEYEGSIEDTATWRDFHSEWILNKEPKKTREEKVLQEFMYDNVDHPKHYKSSPSGVEVIQLTEHMNFCLGNAVKYIMRAGIKTPDATEDLKKAVWYLQRELARITPKENT